MISVYLCIYLFIYLFTYRKPFQPTVLSQGEKQPYFSPRYMYVCGYPFFQILNQFTDICETW
jgi:hypothetical protein